MSGPDPEACRIILEGRGRVILVGKLLTIPSLHCKSGNVILTVKLARLPGRRRQSYPGRQSRFILVGGRGRVILVGGRKGTATAGSPPPYSLALVYTPLLRRYWLPAHPSHPIPIAAARRKSGLRGCCDFRFSSESKGLANLRFPNAQIITNVLGLSNPDRPNVKCCSWSFVKQVAN